MSDIDPQRSGRVLLCPFCSYNLINLPRPRCPECGHEFSGTEISAALSGQLDASPWDNEEDRLASRFIRTMSLVLIRPRSFLLGFPLFYEPGKAIGLWMICACLGGGLHAVRFVSLLAAANVPRWAALIASGVAACLLVVGVWCTEWLLAHGLHSCLRSTAGEKPFPYWRGVLRYGVVFFPLTSLFFLLRQVTDVRAGSGMSEYAQPLCLVVSGLALTGKVMVLLLWWMYLIKAITATHPSKTEAIAAEFLIFFVSMCAILYFGVIGGTLRWFA